MKKLIFLIAILLTGLFADAQTVYSYGKDNQTYFENTTDYAMVGTRTRDWVITAPCDFPTAQLFTCALSGDSAHYTVQLNMYGRVSDLAAWSAIGSPILWCQTTSDTVIVFSNTTENRYRQYRALFTPGGKGGTVTNMELKLFSPD